MPKKNRLDLHLLTKGLVDSRQKAQQLIRAGMVKDRNGTILDKPGMPVSIDLEIEIKKSDRFVSRGGEKLLAAIEAFQISLLGRVCLDCGISTGGFTDCLLQNGASLVYGIDVGYGQTAWSIRNDPKVILKERTNIRYLKPEDIYAQQDQFADFAVADLSFISLKLVLPVIKSLLKPEHQEALILVKPQFEIGKDKVGKGGVVRDLKDHLTVLNSIVEFSLSTGWEVQGVIPSPLRGAAGNQEYLVWLKVNGLRALPDLEILIKNALD